MRVTVDSRVLHCFDGQRDNLPRHVSHRSHFPFMDTLEAEDRQGTQVSLSCQALVLSPCQGTSL